jgi:hypothetical protein
MKKPAFQFYPGDWRKDQNLSRASLRAKGALIEILCLAFECEKRGVLKTGNKPWSVEEIAHAMGGDKIENISAIEELLTLKVLKKDKKSAIFSARMVRDEKISKVRRDAGSKGGNPILVKQTPKQNPTPSSSSSSSTSVNTELGLSPEDKEFFRIFRHNAPASITDDQLKKELAAFRQKYHAVPANQSGPLIFAWVANIGKGPIIADHLDPKKNKNVFI